MGVARQFEKLNALVHVGFVGVLVPLDLALAAILLLAPLVRHFLEEGRVDEPVELVDIHGVDAILKPLVFGLMPLDRLLVLAALVGVAGVQRIAHPFQHLVVELQPPEQFGELRFQRLLAHIVAAAGSRVALAFIGVAGAMIIDVAFLLDLADHRAAAGMAGDQPGEGEVVLAALGLLGEAAVEHALHALP